MSTSIFRRVCCIAATVFCTALAPFLLASPPPVTKGFSVTVSYPASLRGGAERLKISIKYDGTLMYDAWLHNSISANFGAFQANTKREKGKELEIWITAADGAYKTLGQPFHYKTNGPDAGFYASAAIPGQSGSYFRFRCNFSDQRDAWSLRIENDNN